MQLASDFAGEGVEYSLSNIYETMHMDDSPEGAYYFKPHRG
jgi:hypothetical protein